MNGVKSATHLSVFLNSFSEINNMRPTRMGVFETGADAVIDYWLEDDLPLVGIDAEKYDNDKLSIQILLANKEGSEKSHFTHVIKDVRMVKLNLSNDGKSDGIDILGFDGSTTVLSFENTEDHA